MSDGVNEGESREVGLKTLRLRPGIMLTIQRVGAGAAVIEAKFVAAIEGKGVMLTPAGKDGHTADIVVGADYLIQGFNGQTDFSFTVPALNVFTTPFAYVLFGYPGAVRAKQVRKAMRMKTSLCATISPRGQDKPLKVSIVDLSVDGAMVACADFLGAVGSLFDLVLPINVDDVHTNLHIVAKLRHRTSLDNEGSRIGFSFENLSWEHRLLLNYVLDKLGEAQSFVVES